MDTNEMMKLLNERGEEMTLLLEKYRSISPLAVATLEEMLLDIRQTQEKLAECLSQNQQEC